MGVLEKSGSSSSIVRYSKCKTVHFSLSPINHYSFEGKILESPRRTVTSTTFNNLHPKPNLTNCLANGSSFQTINPITFESILLYIQHLEYCVIMSCIPVTNIVTGHMFMWGVY